MRRRSGSVCHAEPISIRTFPSLVSLSIEVMPGTEESLRSIGPVTSCRSSSRELADALASTTSFGRSIDGSNESGSSKSDITPSAHAATVATATETGLRRISSITA
jgi:hypothetical protein